MGHIFVSHVEEDALMADALCAALYAEGYGTWNYRQDGKPGLSYLLQTGSAIDESAAVFLLISESSLVLQPQVFHARVLGPPGLGVRLPGDLIPPHVVVDE